MKLFGEEGVCNGGEFEPHRNWVTWVNRTVWVAKEGSGGDGFGRVEM